MNICRRPANILLVIFSVPILAGVPRDCVAQGATQGSAAGAAENRNEEQVKPEQEMRLRRDLRKLSRSGISQLLRWELEVDREQKRRANTSSNPRELARLAEDEDSGVRFFVAANRHTPLGTRLALANDAEPAVRSGVAIALAYDPLASAQARQLTEAIATQLSRDEHVLVRLSLVTNEELPAPLYESLAQDVDYVVRQKAAENPNTRGEALVYLSQDTVITVQTAALKHRNMPPMGLEQLAGSPDPLVRLAICQNVNTPIGALDRLSSDPLAEVRKLVAGHPNTTLHTLQKLASDGDVEVVLAVAEHPKADRALLMELAFDDTDGSIRVAAQRRLEPVLRKEIREDILERWKTD